MDISTIIQLSHVVNAKHNSQFHFCFNGKFYKMKHKTARKSFKLCIFRKSLKPNFKGWHIMIYRISVNICMIFQFSNIVYLAHNFFFHFLCTAVNSVEYNSKNATKSLKLYFQKISRSQFQTQSCNSDAFFIASAKYL